MKKVTKFNFKTLLVLFLSVMLCFSTALSVACDKGNSSSSSSSSSSETKVYPTDTQSVLNGDFEFSTFTKKATEFPVSSSISWVRSSDSITSSAVSSSYTSGIIDTATDVHKEYAKAAGFPVISGEGEEVAYYNPGTPEALGFVSADDLFSFNEEENNSNDEKIPMTGTKVLMIHNEVKGSDGKGNGEGTAQKFTSSSSLSLARHEFAKLTVWVKTHNLVSNYYDNGEFGAYIAVQNTVSSATTPFIIKNINTGSQWAQYSIYLSASDFATSSFKVVLGLGFGSKEIRRDYVEGFAFFDNVHFEIIDKEEFDNGVNGVTEYNLYDDDNEVKEELTANENGTTFIANDAETDEKYTVRSFHLSHARENEVIDSISFDGGNIKHNDYSNDRFTQSKGEVSATTLSALNVTGPTSEDAEVLYFNHADFTSTSFVTEQFKLDANSYLKLSFWVKVETANATDTALSVTLNDLGQGSSEAVDTVIASNVNTKDYKDNENFNNWIEYVLFVSNNLDDNQRVFTLTFDFGTTATFITDIPWSLTKGTAIITRPVGYYLSESDYTIADTSNYSYAKKVRLTADLTNGVESEDKNDDSYKFNHGLNYDNTIVNDVATNVNGYKGVVGGSTFVGGSEPTLYNDDSVVAGLVNSKYAENYDADIKNALEGLGAIDNNQYVQPLLIKTIEGGKTFGYVSSNASISANSVAVITVKVKVVDNAVAYIYLTNSDALDSFNVLGVDVQGKKVENGELVNDGNPLQKDFVISVTSSDMDKVRDVDNGWLTVKIIVKAGKDAISYRTELWNGERNGESAAHDGIVLFDDYSATTVADYETVILELNKEYGGEPTATPFTRIPTLIKSTDKDGNVVEEYKTYKATDVIYEFETSKSLIVDLSTIVVDHEIDNTDANTDSDSDSSSSDSSSSEETSFSWALQITSIIIAGVLIVLLIVVLVKMLVDKYGNKKNSSKNYYNRNSREKAGLAIEAKNAKKAKATQTASEEDIVEVEEEVTPYDYDNIENNIEAPVSEEVVEETVETVEEAVEEATDAPAEGSDE